MTSVNISYTCPLCSFQEDFNPESLNNKTLIDLRNKLSRCENCNDVRFINLDVPFNVVVNEEVLRCINENTVSFGSKNGELKRVSKAICANKRDRRGEYIRIKNIVAANATLA